MHNNKTRFKPHFQGFFFFLLHFVKLFTLQLKHTSGLLNQSSMDLNQKMRNIQIGNQEYSFFWLKLPFDFFFYDQTVLVGTEGFTNIFRQKYMNMFLPFVRKEPSPRWCRVRKRCSCVRTGWRTCPTLT